MMEYGKRRSRLLNELEVGDIAVLFAGKAPKSTADSQYKLRTNKSFYYLTGLSSEGYVLALQRKRTEMREILFIEKPNYDIEKWVGRMLTIEQAKEKSGADEVMYLDQFENWLNGEIVTGEAGRVLVDADRYRANEPLSDVQIFARDIRDKYAGLQIGSVHTNIAEMRLYKSPAEIELMRKAIELTKVGILGIIDQTAPGKGENEIEAEFAYHIRKGGAQRTSFDTIAAGGGNAAILHYVDNNQKLVDGDLLLLDLGAQYAEYAADISRTIPVNGRYTDRQREYYNLVLKAQRDVMDIIKPGTHFSQMQETAIKSISESLIKMGKIEDPKDVSKYYYHGVGHYLGLDVHDVGSRDRILKPGMVITCEPGIYVADEGLGIRIEDDILITEDGHENLSADIPKSIEEIEKLMNK